MQVSGLFELSEAYWLRLKKSQSRIFGAVSGPHRTGPGTGEKGDADARSPAYAGRMGEASR